MSAVVQEDVLIQLEQFVEGQPPEVARMVRSLSPLQASNVMKQGRLPACEKTTEAPMAILRKFLVQAVQDEPPMVCARLLQQCCNAQLAEVVYETMSKVDLEEELESRGIPRGDNYKKTNDCMGGFAQQRRHVGLQE